MLFFVKGLIGKGLSHKGTKIAKKTLVALYLFGKYVYLTVSKKYPK